MREGRKEASYFETSAGGDSRSTQGPASEKLANVLCSGSHSLQRAGAELPGSLNVAGESPRRFSLRSICN